MIELEDSPQVFHTCIKQAVFCVFVHNVKMFAYIES